MDTYIWKIKSNNDRIFFTGYASVFYIKDCDNDIILPGSFITSIKNIKRNGLIILWEHNINKPIGNIIDIYEDKYGLFIKGEVLVKNNEMVFNLISKGTVSGLSIGYKVENYHVCDKSNTKYIKKIDLIEISIVTSPANKAARITTIQNNIMPNLQQGIRVLESEIVKTIENLRELRYS